MGIDWGAVIDRLENSAVDLWPTPGALAQRLDKRTIQTPALELIDEKLVEAYNTPDSRLIISMPPQEGKSQRASRRFPFWALLQNPELRIAMASYESRIAERWGRSVRDDIRAHPEMGLTIHDGLSAQKEWQLKGHEGGMFSVGVGGAMTGRPVDLLLIDDPVKGREQADSQTIREKTWDWWSDVALSRLAPGAPVILILTRWHNDALAGRLIAEGGWEVLNIPAQAEAKDGTDPLGRSEGEYMISARGRTTAQWESRKISSGPKTWASLYQGRPSPEEGGVFPRDWETYRHRMFQVKADGTHWVPGMGRDDYELIQSWDFTFKDTKGSDYVVGQVWLRIAGKIFLLDMVRERMNFNASVQAVRAMSAKWPQAHAKLIEDKANGPAVISSLSSTIPGIIPVEPEGSKYSRASAVSPFAYSGNIVLPEHSLMPLIGDFLQEARDFPNGPHDDMVDALSQAATYLLVHQLPGDSDLTAQEFQDLDQLGWSISPF